MNYNRSQCWLIHILGISLLQQSTPEFIVILRMNEYKSSIVSRETIINYNINPFTEVPKTEVEYSCIAFVKSLIIWYNLLHYMVHT